MKSNRFIVAASMTAAFMGSHPAAATTALPANAAAQVASWDGRYVWEESVGQHGVPGEGIAAFITYTLAVGPGNGPTRCTLNGQGLQTNKRIQCTVTPRGNAAIVKFYGYGPDNMFRDGYSTGQVLFTLTRGPAGITTSLQGLTASSRSTPRSGRLFRPVR